ncbi:MAG: ABC transporter substrate-binding protein [Chloroflexi bacterium]|nr:ABC transporter substrate-binding protein [Chloroflexota bacterium]
MKSKLTILLTLLMAMSLILSACGGDSEPAPAEPSAPEEPAASEPEAPSEPALVRIGYAGSPDTLNPGAAVLSESYLMFELVYDTMYDLNLDGTFSLSLADSSEVSDDNLVWTFNLRDATFHDGTPLTAEDIVFSYDLYANTEGYAWMGDYTYYFESVEAPDAKTVVITLSEAIPNLDSQLVWLYVLPKHIWENEDAVEFENVEMIGSGPFKMVEYKQNEFVQLAANPDHPKPPKVDEVIFQTFDNNDALVQAIKTGQVDMITEFPATAIESLRETENVEVVVGAPFAPTVTDIIFNQCSAENCPEGDGICSGHPSLQDRNVRLALAHATDKLKIIDVIYLGLASPGTTLIPDGLGVWYNTDLEDYAFDVAKANQILDDAGYADSDSDGVREMPDGTNPLVYRLNWPSDTIDGPRLAELLSEMWGEVGVKVEPQAMDPDAVTAACCPAFDFDVILWGWGSDPDPNLLLSVMTTDEIPTGSSETGYSNAEFDELYYQQASEMDFETRKELVWKMQKIVFDDVVYIIPYYDPALQAYRTDSFAGWITDQAKVELADPTSLTVIEPVQ